jgi:hemerythrin-like metal-binding protein
VALLNSSVVPSIGIGVFDREHLELVETINELQAAVDAGGERSAIGPLLSKLAKDTKALFLSEEAMMAASKYPGLALHRMKHQRLLEQLNALLMRYARDDSTMNMHSLNFLRDWLNSHIQNDDLNFGLWQNEHGKR